MAISTWESMMQHIIIIVPFKTSTISDGCKIRLYFTLLKLFKGLVCEIGKKIDIKIHTWKNEVLVE